MYASNSHERILPNKANLPWFTSEALREKRVRQNQGKFDACIEHVIKFSKQQPATVKYFELYCNDLKKENIHLKRKISMLEQTFQAEKAADAERYGKLLGKLQMELRIEQDIYRKAEEKLRGSKSLEADVKLLKDELREKTDQIAKKDEHITFLQDEFSALKEYTEEYESTQKKLEMERDRLLKQVCDLKTVNNAFARTNSDLKMKMADYRRSMQEVKPALESKDKQIQRLKNEVREVRDSEDKLSSQFDAAQEERINDIAAMQDEKEGLRLKVAECEREHEKSIIEYEVKIGDLKCLVKQLEDKLTCQPKAVKSDEKTPLEVKSDEPPVKPPSTFTIHSTVVGSCENQSASGEKPIANDAGTDDKPPIHCAENVVESTQALMECKTSVEKRSSIENAVGGLPSCGPSIEVLTMGFKLGAGDGLDPLPAIAPVPRRLAPLDTCKLAHTNAASGKKKSKKSKSKKPKQILEDAPNQSEIDPKVAKKLALREKRKEDKFWEGVPYADNDEEESTETDLTTFEDLPIDSDQSGKDIEEHEESAKVSVVDEANEAVIAGKEAADEAPAKPILDMITCKEPIKSENTSKVSATKLQLVSALKGKRNHQNIHQRNVHFAEEVDVKLVEKWIITAIHIYDAYNPPPQDLEDLEAELEMSCLKPMNPCTGANYRSKKRAVSSPRNVAAITTCAATSAVQIPEDGKPPKIGNNTPAFNSPTGSSQTLISTTTTASNSMTTSTNTPNRPAMSHSTTSKPETNKTTAISTKSRQKEVKNGKKNFERKKMVAGIMKNVSADLKRDQQLLDDLNAIFDD